MVERICFSGVKCFLLYKRTYLFNSFRMEYIFWLFVFCGRKKSMVFRKEVKLCDSIRLVGEFYNSEKMRILVGFIVVVFTVPYLQIQLTGGAYLIQVASGDVIPFWLSALLFYVVIIIYVWV